MFRKRITSIISATAWTAAVVVAGLAVDPGVAGASMIASVSITGSVTQPVISIAGTGFGTPPAPDPAYPVLGPGTDPANGYDYGTNLYFSDTNSPSSQIGPWGAGLNSHTGSGIALIGLRVSTFTDSQISFSLGGEYAQYYQPKGYYVLAPGDTFTVHVGGLTCSGAVNYSGDAVSCIPPPVPRLAALFITRWFWKDARTRLASLRVRQLPPGSTVTAACHGRGCPTRHLTVAAAHIASLVRVFQGRVLYAGASVRFTVRAPGRTPERVLFVMRRGKPPVGRLL